jgi:hypothetical protein
MVIGLCSFLLLSNNGFGGRSKPIFSDRGGFSDRDRDNFANFQKGRGQGYFGNNSMRDSSSGQVNGSYGGKCTKIFPKGREQVEFFCRIVQTKQITFMQRNTKIIGKGESSGEKD